MSEKFDKQYLRIAQIWSENSYAKRLKGRTKKSASIDRIDPRKGYEIGSIQVLSLQENSSKGV